MTHVSRTFLPGLLAASLGLCMAGTALAAGNDSNPGTSQQLTNPPSSSTSASDRQGNGATGSQSTTGDRSAMGGTSSGGQNASTGNSGASGSTSTGSNSSTGNGSATGSTTSAGANSSMGSSAATGNANASGKEATARNIFEQLDANHDGQLSFEEFSRATFQHQ